VARLVYLVVWAGSLALLYRLGRQLVDPLAALAGVVLFALFSFSLTHAASFRIDGLVLPVLLAVALLLLKPTTARVAAAGALSGVALALTIKAVLWAPAFTGVLALGLWHRQPRVKPVLAGAIAAVASFAAIMLAHAWWLSAGDAPAPAISTEGLQHTGFRMLLEDGLFPRYEILVLAVLQNPITWVFAAAGVALALAGLRHPAARRTSLILLLLALPDRLGRVLRQRLALCLCRADADGLPAGGPRVPALPRRRRRPAGSPRRCAWRSPRCRWCSAWSLRADQQAGRSRSWPSSTSCSTSRWPISTRAAWSRASPNSPSSCRAGA
jgi:hypothetical protein